VSLYKVITLLVTQMMEGHAMGCLLGGMVGDAAGAVLEFSSGGPLKPEVVERAMRMPGGGVHNVGPGQITDDGELDLALLAALAEATASSSSDFPIEAIAANYITWHRSEPFDIGMTCGRALARAYNAADVRANAARHSMLSEANGALMRCAPIAVWAAFWGKDPWAAAMQDAMLTHPSRACLEANAVYCVALTHLLRNPGDAAGAVKAAELLADSCGDTVRGWLLDESAQPLPRIACHMHAGHVRHAFVLAFGFLRAGTDYETAVRETLLRGGDTDTNAKIVGNMVGALHGVAGIPRYMADPVLAFDPVTFDVRKHLLGINRPACCRAANVARLLDAFRR
jgi:ADP-ribosyl-[dinitrogen reductase] hydrolase